MSKPKIITSVINNYDNDQRVQKVTQSLQKFGFDVQVVATTLRGKPKSEFNYPVSILNLKNQSGLKLYFEFNWKLFWKLLKITKKENILLANDVDALLPNYLVSKIKGTKLVFDSHEIFSELPSLTDRKLKKKVWKSIESYIVPKLKHFYTVSDGYAKWFDEEYNNKPKVVRNVPILQSTDTLDFEVKLPKILPNQKVIIYQGVLNFSRGIGKMIEAMLYLDNVQFWIVGNGPQKQEFEKLSTDLNVDDKVKFIGNVHPSELKKITQQADLGLSLEEDFGISYRFALPNKIFDYIHAGIPILGTYLPEIKQTVDKHKIGKTIQSHDPKHIALMIKEMLEEGKTPYKQNLIEAAKIFNWEHEEKILKEIFEPFLKNNNY